MDVGSSSVKHSYTSHHPDSDFSFESAYENLIRLKEVREDLKKTFPEVRLLVVGRSGAGKSTLIQLLLGNKVPTAIKFGKAGTQDIAKEWRHPDRDLPLLIHDSNGIGTDGQKRMEEIQKFLGKSQANINAAEFSHRVHAIWYVFSAVDNRVGEDNGLLKMLDSYGKDLPLLLIMTHSDKMGRGDEAAEDKVLKEVLLSVSDDERRRRLRETVVRVRNKVEVGEDGDIMDKRKVNKRGLELVVERTKGIMKEDVWITWAACQAVDTKAKVEASTKLIMKKHYYQTLASIPLRVIPFFHQMQLRVMFGSITEGLAKIWNTSSSANSNLQKAIIACPYFREQKGRAVMRTLERDITAAMALFMGILALLEPSLAILNTALSIPKIMVAGLKLAARRSSSTDRIGDLDPGTSTDVEESGNAPKLLMSYGLLVLGAAMYAHAYDIAAQGSVDDYLRLYQQFLTSHWATEIVGFAQGYSGMEVILGDDEKRRKDLNSRIASQLMEFLQKLFKEKEALQEKEESGVGVLFCLNFVRSLFHNVASLLDTCLGR